MNLLFADCEKREIEKIRHFVIVNQIQIDEIFIASNEEEMIILCKQEQPDIIIADMDIAKVSVSGFIHLINKYVNSVKFILLHKNEYNIKQYEDTMLICPIEHISKPINFAELKLIMLRIINEIKQKKWEEHQIDVLKSAMSDKLPLLRDVFLCDLMDGTDIENLREKAGFLGMEILENKQYLAICINWSDTENNGLFEGNLYAIAVMQLFKQVLDVYFINYFVIREKTRIACILLIDQPGDELKNKLEIIFSDLCNIAKTKYGLNLSIGVGIAADEPEHIYYSYHQACDVLRRGRFSGGGPSFFFSDIHPLYNPTKIKSVDLTSNAQTEILDCLYCNDTEKLTEIIHSELERIRKGRTMTENAVVELKIELSSFLIKLANRILYEDDTGERDKMFLRELLNQESIIDVERKMNEIVIEMAEMLSRNRLKRTSKIIEDVKEELRRSLCDNINVQIIAYKIGLSPNYLSAIFKAETGTRLTEYILKMRLEKAEELLLRSNKKVAEIAEIIGCGDQAYFSKLFKKQYKLSPTEYRLKASADNNPDKT